MIEAFGETQNVTVSVLVDNQANLLVKSTEAVRRFTKKPLLAEHGFAALIDLQNAGVRILWDAGLTRITLLENMQRMEIDPTRIEKIVLSHGHGDHTAAVAKILEAIDLKPKSKEWAPGATMEQMRAWAQVRPIPVIAHPAAFRERWREKEDGTRVGPIQPPPLDEWEALGAQIVPSSGPYELGPGCWATGEVPRLSFEHSGRPPRLFYRQGDEFIRDDIEEDQAIVINVKDKGLVVVSGCAHSGIVNTVNYARQISGVERVWAILGGFHLAWAQDKELEQTLAAIQDFEPQLIAPAHCTGFEATCRFAAQMPEQFVLGVVGTTYLF